MKKLIFIFLLTFSLQAIGESKKYSFLDKYLNDPYSSIKPDDYGYSGDLFWDYAEEEINYLTVFIDEISFNDVGENERVEMVVPIMFSTTQSGMTPTYGNLIFSSSPTLYRVNIKGMAVHYQHWNPKPKLEITSPRMSYNPDFTIVNVNLPLIDQTQFPLKYPSPVIKTADLNNDGLNESMTIFSALKSPFFSGKILEFRNLKINTGVKLVDESEIEESIRDARLGYIASFTQTIFQSKSNLDDQEKSTENSAPMASRQFTPIGTHTVNPLFVSHPELDFDIIGRGFYMPDIQMYFAGIERGNQVAAKSLKSFYNTNDAITGFEKEINVLLTETKGTNDEASIKLGLNKFSHNIDSLSAIANYFNDKLSNWKTIILAPMLSPRRITEDFKKVKQTTLPSIISNEDLKTFLNKLDEELIINTSTDGDFLLNIPKIVGMSWAYQNLMAMRSTKDYSKNIKDPRVRINVQRQIPLMGNKLSDLASSGKDLQSITSTEFIYSGIMSGYNDLLFYMDYDVQKANYIDGYNKAQLDDLNLIKRTLGQYIPNLASATDLNQAITLTSGYILKQQTEINRLNNVINQLNTTITNLNQLLTNANNFILSLQQTNASLQNTLQEANRTLGKVGNAADSAGTFFKAGAGFLIGGPLGALACAIFC